MAAIPLNPAIRRGHSGVGLDIDASGLMRLAVKAEAYAEAGDRPLYEITLELLAERLEGLAPVAVAIRAELAVKP